ncbi:5'-3' exoribonuclease 1 [Bulinus truncatus]|nr:5'-3' exoribonuclease 1 [Bulinus truncatus]
MLGLTSHEPHLSLLREEVRFGGRRDKNKRPTTPEETTFHLLHLSLMRDYLAYEFSDLKYDMETFESAFSDLRYLESKLGGKSINESANVGFQKKKLKPLKPFKVTKDGNPFLALEDESANNAPVDDFLVDDDDDDGESDADDEEEDEADDYDEDEDDFNTVGDEFKLHKRDYYMNKMSYSEVTSDVLQDQARGYVIAIQWILLYYFEGCPSWSWYYPHHYAPYISDVKGFSDMTITFELSKPFLPFQQLMAVLPAASKELLPPAYQSLMTEESSQILDFYPVNFETDLNGKQQDWEAVVLIPFIEENRLLEAMASKEPLLTKEERERNRHGPHILSFYTPENQGFYPSPMPEIFPDLHASRAKITELDKDIFHISSSLLRKGLLDTFKSETYFPGFPRLKFLPHTHELAKCGCKVFQHNSRGENMLLKIQQNEGLTLEDVADELLGNVTFVGWPHLHEAKVVAVANESFLIELVEDTGKKSKREAAISFNRKKLTSSESSVIAKEALCIKERHHDRFAIEVGNTEIVIYACPMTGRMYTYGAQGMVMIEKQFAANRAPYLHQMTVKDLDVEDGIENMLQNLDEIFPPGCDIFMLGNPHYGAQGQGVSEVYLNNYQAGQQLGIDGHTMSRITGSVFIERSGPKGGKANIGLNLKFTKRCEEVPGYTRKLEDGWGYSFKCIQIVADYINSFPDLWKTIKQLRSDTDVFTEDGLFPESSKTKLTDVLKYLEELPCTKSPRMKFGCEVLSEDRVKEIEEITAALDPVPDIVKMKVKPRVVFRPLANQGSLVPDPAADFQLYDRIVVVKMGYSVPFGKRGTIIGIPSEEEGGLTPHSLYDVVFDEPFSGGITLRCSPNKGYRVPGSAMLNLTYGEFRKNVDRREPSTRIGGRLQLYSSSDRASSGSGSSSGKAYNSFNNNNSFGHKHLRNDISGSYSDKTSLWKQQQSASRSQKAPFIQQPVKWENGQPLFGQVFAMQNQSPGKFTPPKFVTPKVQSPHQARMTKNVPQEIKGGDVENSEFDSLWKNLQSHKHMSQVKKATDFLPKLPAPAVPHQQSSAASVAPHHQPVLSQKLVILDSKTTAQSGQSAPTTPVSIATASPSVSAEQSLALTPTSVLKATAATSQPVGAAQSTAPTTTSVSLQNLFQNASEAALAKSHQQGPENSEFLAMFNSLKTQATSIKTTSTQMTEDNNKSLADIALKQLLKIGLDTTTTSAVVPEASQLTVVQAPSTNNLPSGSVSTSTVSSSSQPAVSTSEGPAYGRQVSLQELFEEANRQQKHQTVHPSQTAAANMKEHRDPIAELGVYCKTHLNQGIPQFDYKNQPKQNAYIANVILPNGQRYEGSLCKTKEEAAKSAASMALLCLNSKPNHPMMAGYIPGPQRSSVNRFFSANSAFSPISLSGSNAGLLTHPPQMTSQMLLTPQHFINQPPPSLALHHLFQQSQQLSFQTPGHPAQNLGREPPRHPQQTGQSASSLLGQFTLPYALGTQSAAGYSLSSQTTTMVSATSNTITSSISQQFIPLQVSRNQKHPNKRKESESESASDVKKENVISSSSSVEQSKVRDTDTTAVKNEAVKAPDLSGVQDLNKANGTVLKPDSVQIMPTATKAAPNKCLSPPAKVLHFLLIKKVCCFNLFLPYCAEYVENTVRKDFVYNNVKQKQYYLHCQ